MRNNTSLLFTQVLEERKERASLCSSPHFSLLFSSYGDRVEHFRVLEGGGQYCIWDESFCSLNRLVDFYRTHSIAVEEVVRLRDPRSSPRQMAHPGRNPYPNPYKSYSQESLHTAHFRSPRLLEPVRPLMTSSFTPVTLTFGLSDVTSLLFLCVGTLPGSRPL